MPALCLCTKLRGSTRVFLVLCNQREIESNLPKLCSSRDTCGAQNAVSRFLTALNEDGARDLATKKAGTGFAEEPARIQKRSQLVRFAHKCSLRFHVWLVLGF